MSSKFVAVAVATGVLLIASCKWFSTAPKENAFNIESKWTIDSIAAGKDSSLANALLATKHYLFSSFKIFSASTADLV